MEMEMERHRVWRRRMRRMRRGGGGRKRGWMASPEWSLGVQLWAAWDTWQVNKNS
jgi:hypothetical protein